MVELGFGLETRDCEKWNNFLAMASTNVVSANNADFDSHFSTSSYAQTLALVLRKGKYIPVQYRALPPCLNHRYEVLVLRAVSVDTCRSGFREPENLQFLLS